jgi:hypothetical protein
VWWERAGCSHCVAHAPGSWLPRLIRGTQPVFHSCGANARRGAQWLGHCGVLVILQRASCRTRNPATPAAGNQLKAPGAGVVESRHAKQPPRLFFCGFLSVPAER